MKSPGPKAQSQKAYWERLRAKKKALEREATKREALEKALERSCVQTEIGSVKQAFRDILAK